LTEYREQRREFKRKREEHCSNTTREINFHQMSQAEMKKIRQGQAHLFKMMINALMKEFQPKRDDLQSWEAFEGADEEAMHFPRLHIMKVLNRKPETMYGQRRVSPQIQEARAEKIETIFTKREIQRTLAKVKSMLGQLVESQNNDPAGWTKRGRIVGELYQFLNLISPEARGELFGEKDPEAI
jgi:hypothetical protein